MCEHSRLVPFSSYKDCPCVSDVQSCILCGHAQYAQTPTVRVQTDVVPATLDCLHAAFITSCLSEGSVTMFFGLENVIYWEIYPDTNYTEQSSYYEADSHSSGIFRMSPVLV
jgi:hypothetical protein